MVSAGSWGTHSIDHYRSHWGVSHCVMALVEHNQAKLTERIDRAWQKHGRVSEVRRQPWATGHTGNTQQVRSRHGRICGCISYVSLVQHNPRTGPFKDACN